MMPFFIKYEYISQQEKIFHKDCSGKIYYSCSVVLKNDIKIYHLNSNPHQFLTVEGRNGDVSSYPKSPLEDDGRESLELK